MKFETHGLLAGCYVSEKSLSAHRTHVWELDADDYPVRPLCGKVQADNVCPDGGNTEAPATCKHCAKLDPRVHS